MATQVEVPPLGESVTQAILVKWHKTDGDAVKTDGRRLYVTRRAASWGLIGGLAVAFAQPWDFGPVTVEVAGLMSMVLVPALSGRYGENSLIATRRWTGWDCSATKTVPIPPSPSFRLIW